MSRRATSTTFSVRVERDELERWRRAASAEGLSLGGYVRKRLDGDLWDSSSPPSDGAPAAPRAVLDDLCSAPGCGNEHLPGEGFCLPHRKLGGSPFFR